MADDAPATAGETVAAGATVWHEDPAFWTDLAPRLTPGDQLWRQAEADAAKLAALLPPGARVLDQCCGQGRHAIALAARGFAVTAVDRTRQYLDEGVRRAAVAGVRVDFVEADVRAYCQAGSFDAVLNLATSFGFFADPADDAQVVKLAHRSLAGDGLLVMDMIGKEIRAREFVERDWREVDGAAVLVNRSVSDGWSHVNESWTVIDVAGRRRFRRTYRMYSAVELSALLEACGYGSVTVHGGLSGEPYDYSAHRLVALARK
jgi:SAM-dependent methyltransferase